MMEIRRVLVGVDGSGNARRAVEWTAVLARSVGAHIVAVHALGLLAHDESGALIPAQSVRADAARLLEEEWCAPLAGLDHECVVKDGSAVSVVLETAEALPADLIVLGSRGLGGYPEQLLGSTSTQVAQHSRIPVVIVPDAS
jgi:nucleotide-binding universal stress UspA family protein